jgi:predicted nuclease of predicted toxin-antitoxin system
MPWIDVDEGEGIAPNERGRARAAPHAETGKARPRFFADETIPTQAISLLRKRGFDVIAARIGGGGVVPAQNQLAFARRFARILVTCDEDYLEERSCPTTNVPTVMVFGFGEGQIDEILSAFKCLDYVASLPGSYGNWCKIYARPEEWVEHVSPAYGAASSRRLRWQEGRLQTWAEE